MTTINLSIAATADDSTSHSSGAFGDAFLAAGWFGPGSREYIGVISFANVTVPQGDTIDSATLIVRPTILDAGAITYDLRFVAQKIANATQPSGTVNPTSQSWTETTAQTTYSGTPTTGADQNVDITAVIQELVNQGSWASGNRINLMIRNNGMTGGTDKRVEYTDFTDVGAGTASRLSITHSAPGAAVAKSVFPFFLR